VPPFTHGWLEQTVFTARTVTAVPLVQLPVVEFFVVFVCCTEEAFVVVLLTEEAVSIELVLASGGACGYNADRSVNRSDPLK